MVRRRCLTDKEKADIVSKLANGENALLSRDIRTVQKYINNPLAKTFKKDKGKSKVLTRVKRQLHKSLNSTINIIFENLGLCHVSKSGAL